MKICVPRSSVGGECFGGSDYVYRGVLTGLLRNGHEVLTPAGPECIRETLGGHSDIDFIFTLQVDYQLLSGLPSVTSAPSRMPPQVVWFLDDPLFLEQSAKIAATVDLSFSQSVLAADHLGEETPYLPLFADTDMFHPLELTREDQETRIADVVFAGNMNHPFREHALKLLSRRFDCAFYGSDQYRGRIAYTELPKIYNGARIAIDLPGYKDVAMRDSRCEFAVSDAWSQRAFEVSATMTFQLVPRRRFGVSHLEEGSEVVSYCNLAELEALISRYLDREAERGRIAENAYRRTIAEHSHAARMKQMVTKVRKALHLPG